MDFLLTFLLALIGPFLFCGAGVLIWGRKGAWIVLGVAVFILFSAHYWLPGAQGPSLPDFSSWESVVGLVAATSYFVLSAYLAARYVR